MLTRRIFISLSLVLFLFSTAAAQTSEEPSGLIKTADGILVVSNEPGNLYTMEIRGKTIAPVPDHALWFTVDGNFFQIVTATKAQFLNGQSDKGMSEKALLTAHQKWESDYIAQTLNRKLDVRSEWIKLPNNMTALAWSYEMPQVDSRQTAAMQLYLTVLKGDRVLALNTAVEGKNDPRLQQAFLFSTLSTLKPRDKPLSLKEASEQVTKGKQ
jgi:hypothetical protein